MIQPSPQLLIKEINDTYTQNNFKNLREYFSKQNQLLNFNFIEFNFTSAVTNQKIAHGLGLIPQDVIVTRITGAGTATLNWGLFDSSNLDITTTGACRIRMFVGSYWNFQSALGNDATTQDVSASAKSTTTATTTAATASVSTSTTFIPPIMQTFTSTGAQTYNLVYAFIISSGSATAGATYVLNGVTYTVVATFASQTLCYLSGSAAPTAASGVLSSGGVGTGDPFITFSSFKPPLYLELELVGGGGGGGGAGTTATARPTGSAGGNSSFGGTILVANGGSATVGDSGGPGGTASIGAGATGVALAGASGSNAESTNTAATNLLGGKGASTPYGDGGAAQVGNGTTGTPNGGGGGSGGGCIGGAGTVTGAGGSAAGTCKAILYPVSLAQYPFVIGAGGIHGNAGTSGVPGGDGAAGQLIAKSCYQ